MLPNAPAEGGWPTREAIDEEGAFVRRTLAKEGLSLGDSATAFAWGEVWSGFGPKGFLAGNGVRYRGD